MASDEGATVPYSVIAGRAVVVGKQPDGDSVRFVPDDPALLRRLQDGDRIRVSADGSVQLRFDGIDAPELHYQGRAQPQGASARDALLQRLGFSGVDYAVDGSTVVAATPAAVPLVIAAEMAEINGRPVSVVFAGASAARLIPSSGLEVDPTPDLLADSVNVWEAASGIAYPLLYTSTPPTLREVFRAAAQRAQAAAAGVWAADSTPSFPVTTAAALGPGGVLIWPKLFRRVIDYLAQRAPGQTLPDWLAATPLNDDAVHPTDSTASEPVPLHTLVTQAGERARFPLALPEVVVEER
jgi:endonuclease YncB( thermonuclease family)